MGLIIKETRSDTYSEANCRNLDIKSTTGYKTKGYNLKPKKKKKYKISNKPCTHVTPRKLARSVARYRLESLGYSRISRGLSKNWKRVFSTPRKKG